jgi:type VI secretion system secreted protein VgrG
MQAALKEQLCQRNNVWIVTPPTAQAELADLEKQTTLMNQTLNDLKQPSVTSVCPLRYAQVTPAKRTSFGGENHYYRWSKCRH